jgi:hypothetical protein
MVRGSWNSDILIDICPIQRAHPDWAIDPSRYFDLARDDVEPAVVAVRWSSDLVGSRRFASSLLGCVLEDPCQSVFFLESGIAEKSPT